MFCEVEGTGKAVSAAELDDNRSSKVVEEAVVGSWLPTVVVNSKDESTYEVEMSGRTGVPGRSVIIAPASVVDC